MEKKKPDNIVFDSETRNYDASIKPYATSLGSPVITASNTTAWKNVSVKKINNKIQAKYLELKVEFDKLMQEYEYNKLIFNAKFNFEPVVGKVYHLYKRSNEETFLSMIAPSQCSFDSMGSFYLNAEQTWEKI